LPANSDIKDTKAPVSPSKDTTTQPDPGWKRLQTIFRKHQEQENPTVESIKSPEPSPATKSDIQRTAEQPEPSKLLSDAPQIETPEVPQPAQLPPVIQRKNNATDTQNVSIERAAAKPENKIQPRETQVPHDDRPAASVSATSKTATNPESSQPNSKISSPSEPRINFEEPNIEEEPEQLNALPLESVWNVQRTEESEPKEQPVPQPTRVHHAPVDSATLKPMLQRSEPESDISSSDFQNESSLDADVTSEMRTPVEILAPSRPRPGPVNAVTHSVTVQRRSQNEPPAPEAQEDRLIETAIGPLPADLWQLIGQKPPASQTPVRESIPSAIQRAEVTPSQHEDVQPKNSSTPVKEINLVDFPAVVQRQPVAEDASSIEQPPVAFPSSPQNIESEPDVDELARKVYARIRQRLSTEWERLRRR
jgi:hypothetical protein